MARSQAPADKRRLAVAIAREIAVPPIRVLDELVDIAECRLPAQPGFELAVDGVAEDQAAEPVAALYEQGRVRHMRGLGDLEDQMCQMTLQGFQGQGSPDRVDALVWALTEGMLLPAAATVQADRVRTVMRRRLAEQQELDVDGVTVRVGRRV